MRQISDRSHFGKKMREKQFFCYARGDLRLSANVRDSVPRRVLLISAHMADFFIR